jgi:transposase-like protein
LSAALFLYYLKKNAILKIQIEGMINIMLEFKYTMDNVIDYFMSTRFTDQRVCPHCSRTHAILYGKYNGRQRYKCKSCRKTFNDFTNTPLAMTHFPEKWGAFMECLLKGMSLRKSARELKVSYVTLFYWRHKLLAAFKEIKPNEMKGSVELQNFYLKYSEKGQKHSGDKKKRIHDKSMSYYNIGSDKVCLLTAMDLFEHIFSMAVCRGFMNNDDIERSIGKLLSKNNIVCSRPKRNFIMFLKRMHIKESKKSLDNTNPVVKYTKDCMIWMSRFKGVASKYLNNYLSLYKFIKSINFDETLSGVKAIIAVLSAVNARNTYKSIRNINLCAKN